MAFEFLKRLTLPKVSLRNLLGGTSIVGIDIGVSSVKIVQLRKEGERAILETYGELKTAPYLGDSKDIKTGFLRFSDKAIVTMVKDLIREAHVTSKEMVTSIPAVSSFVTLVELPTKEPSEVGSAIQFEARKYIPIPISEVLLDWQVIDEGDEAPKDGKTKVLLVAVPKEVTSKFNRVFEGLQFHLRGLEIETFSLVRSLVGHEKLVTALVNVGSQSTTIAIVDKGVVRLSHNIDRGSNELTTALSRGLGITYERAEAFKSSVGLSERPEDREIASVIAPLVEILLSELERIMAAYNRSTSKKIEKINLTGGGSRLKGLIDMIAKRFGVETIQGNPFTRVTYPAFMQPILKDTGPTFSVAVGLALREMTPK